MSFLIDAIMPAGRAAVELSLFVLLPVMVVMLTVMRLMEAWGWLDKLVAALTPLLRPFGLPGLGVFAAVQMNFVSFAAPVAALAMMERRGASDRHLCAVLAMVLAMAQANAVFPMLSMGLRYGPTLALSLAGGLTAAAAAYYLFGRGFSDEEHVTDETLPHGHGADGAKGFFDVVNKAGAEAFKIAIGAMPMLIVSLAAVNLLRIAGGVEALTWALRPALELFGWDAAMVLPAVTKYLAGGTAMMGVVDGMVRAGEIDARLLNASSGFLINALDVAGVAVLISAGPRAAKVWKAAVTAAAVGVALRALGHGVLF